MQVENRIALVTGAARGIGLAISESLMAAGYQVIGVDINEPQLRLVAAEHDSFQPEAVDLTSENEVAALFARVRDQFGGLDALVNNAGTCYMSDFLEISTAEFRQQMAINFDSAFFCCQRAIPLMLARPGVKKIVNISSNGAYNFDVFDPPHYRASKAALDNLTKHLARQYADQNISINSIAPAMTRTDLFDVVPENVLAEAIAGMPRGKPMEPAEIAAWVAFLISPAGDCANGNVIILNQGRDVR